MPENLPNINDLATPNSKKSKLRILHFVPRLSWPLDTGAKLRNYHLARNLAEKAEVHLLAFSDGNEHLNTFDQQYPPRPESFYESVQLVSREAGYTPFKLLRGAVGSIPLPVLNYTSRMMKRALSNKLEDDFDLVQVESIHFFSYLPTIRNARSQPKIVLDWHNIESELMYRYSERSASFPKRLYARHTAQQLEQLEKRALDEFDAHVVVSKRDGERLLANQPDACVSVIENGVDTGFYTDEQIAFAHSSSLNGNKLPSQPNRLLFVGSMDYHANIDAVVDFARNVWPELHTRTTDVVMTIVGRDPGPEVRHLEAIPGIVVTGTVSDVRPFYREAIAAVIPLRVGGGSRLKILEAMAAGTPVVSTTLGAEGLEVENGKNIVIADSNEDLLRAIQRVLENPADRKRLSDAGRALVAERYDWATIGDALYSVYTTLLAETSN